MWDAPRAGLMLDRWISFGVCSIDEPAESCGAKDSFAQVRVEFLTNVGRSNKVTTKGAVMRGS